MEPPTPINGRVATLDQIEKLTEEKPHRNPKDPYTTEMGVVLKLHKVSTDLVRRAWTAIPIPQPPMVFIEERGRSEPNPADPGYNNELSAYNGKVNAVIHMIYMMRGVDVFSVPDDVVPIESDEWFEGLEAYLEIPKGRLARKAAWLLDYVLLDSESDEICQNIIRLSGGILETDVDEAAKSFRDNGISETTTELPRPQGD